MPPTARTLRPLAALGAVGAMLALAGCAPSSASGGGGEPLEGGTVVYVHQQEPACVFGGWIE
ncbi:MAG TPA: ABC transporter substrate-binding protein, partial [Protaetiibacter sp.]|nr:ABC transporter substrate-binding protein [Protaetiibacter sp.]